QFARADQTRRSHHQYRRGTAGRAGHRLARRAACRPRRQVRRHAIRRRRDRTARGVGLPRGAGRSISDDPARDVRRPRPRPSWVRAEGGARMTELRIIFAKDLRRLRWLIAAWLTVVAARVVLRSVLGDVAFAAGVLQLTVVTVSELLVLLDVLLLLVLVSRLIDAEPLVNPDAFWLTRPIRPTRLMTEKLVFAAVWLIAAPVLVQSVAALAITHDAPRTMMAVPSAVLGQLFWVVVLLALATL